MEFIKACRIGIFVLIMLVMAVQAGADERTWDGGGGDTEWATVGNWNPDGYADSDDLTVLSGSPTSTTEHVVADNGGIITLNGSAAVANFSWDTYIGYTAGESRLNILGGASLTDDYGRLGFYGGTSGIATISGTGSTWTNSGDLYLGGGWSDTGGTGEMIITAGGVVSCEYGHMGYSSGSSGTVTISGEGSKWKCGFKLYVGRSGTGELTIADGGYVSCNNRSYLGYNSGSSGTATVSGAGSTWDNHHSYLYVGYSGTGEINITGGGAVSSKCGYLGYKSGSSGTATVSGAESTWGSSLYVGYSGTGVLNITNGGTVSGSLAVLGQESGSSGTVIVSGTDSHLRVNSPYSGYIYVGKYGTGILEITNEGTVSNTNSNCYLGHNSGSSGTVTVSGSGSTWTNSSKLYVGSSGTGVLNITDGGTVSNATCYIGFNSSGSGTVTVSGADSTWTNSGSLYIVGENEYHAGGTGMLTIADGGTVSVTGDTWVTRYGGGAGEIHFDGGTLTTGSLLAGVPQLFGTGTVNTHGLVSDVDLLFDSTHGLNQTLTLDSQPGQDITIHLDQNSTGRLGAGYAGEGTLAIRDGVSVESSYGYIGYKAGSAGEVTVAGSGSTWTNSDNLYVGYEGTGMLSITDGGAVSNAYVYVGHRAGSTGEVTVTGNDSTWTCNGRLSVGYYGAGTMSITDGGAVSNTDGRIGVIDDSSGKVTVDGSGSTWTCSECLYVGGCYGASGETSGELSITNGGTVSNSYDGLIGYWTEAIGEVTVAGSGSTWTSSYSIFVGYKGTGTLNIIDGGTVSNGSYGRIGSSSGSTGEVTVDGSGSTWTNSTTLRVGYEGQGTLNITNGGLVSVAGTLTTGSNGFINMTTGGMLALYGDADDSLDDFLDLIGGTDAIRYWDDSASDWADITGATPGQDYTLTYLTEGDLDGYTVLTVPEPASATILLLGAIAVFRRRKK